MIAVGVNAAGATPDSNADLIKSNALRVTNLKEKSESSLKKIEGVENEAEKARTAITAHATIIEERREAIRENATKVLNNTVAITNLISNS